MELPIRVFFIFFQEASRLEAIHFRELLDIAYSPAMQYKYYEYMRKKYDGMIYPDKPKVPEKPVDMRIQADSEEAKDLLMGVMRSLKRSAGYGG